MPPIKITHYDNKVEKPSANPYYYLPSGPETYDYESTQRIDYIRQKMKSAFVVLPRHERKDGQANEHTQAGMRSRVPYHVPEKQEYTYLQGTEYIREKTNLPLVRSLYIHDYENGQNEHIQAEMKLLGLYNVRKKHEYTYQRGTEYLQEKTNLHYVRALPIHEYEKGQGTQHAQVEMEPGRPYYVSEKHEYTKEQGIEYIREKINTPCRRVFPIHEYDYGQGNKHTRAVKRLPGPYNVSEKHEYTDQQGTEYIREKIHTPMVQWLPSHEYEIGQGKEHTRAAMRSCGPYNVPENYDYTTDQGIEYIREKTHTPHVRMLPKHEYANEQGIEHIQTTMKSPVWPRKQNDPFEFG